ncbi:glycerate kinase [Streptomyces sp. NPDC101225]|uniref:glycerate kinase n=1 Tax=Streptomyces sp. NPDC101225 TaxID=3366135 RepID=UPI00381672DB
MQKNRRPYDTRGAASTAAPVVVIAPDKFRGSMTAGEAAAALADAVRAVLPNAHISLFPMSDGGEGTIEGLRSAGAEIRGRQVSGPLGQPVFARWAQLGTVHYVEAAQACGLELVTADEERRAVRATSFGVGELLRTAAEGSPRRIVVGLGGTASTDGGFGIACALGYGFLDRHCRPLPAHPDSLSQVWEIVPPAGAPLGDTELIAATDVDNPLLGEEGAAAVFAPQKGASPEEVDELESRLVGWSAAISRSFGRDVAGLRGAGAAGGIAGGLMGLCHARTEPGARLMIDLLGVPHAVRRADLVITGEGSLDAQTVRGKVPVSVARLARAAGANVIAVAGRIDRTNAQVEHLFDAMGELSAETRTGEDSFNDAVALAERLTRRLVTDWFRSTWGTGSRHDSDRSIAPPGVPCERPRAESAGRLHEVDGDRPYRGRPPEEGPQCCQLRGSGDSRDHANSISAHPVCGS